MDEMDFRNLLLCVANYYGILSGYWDIRGTYHETSLETRLALLSAMGLKIENEIDLRAAIDSIIEELRWNIPPVVSLDSGDEINVYFNCHKNLIPSYIDWVIYEHPAGDEESGQNMIYPIAEGRVVWGEFTVSQPELCNCGPWQALGDVFEEIIKISLRVPVTLPCGYYKLLVKASSRNLHDELLLIVAPKESFIPDKRETRAGIVIQLYAVRSGKNWGIGNYSDLREIISLASRSGAGFVGMNPLHLLFTENPSHISPYSPSSRRFLNPWYVTVEEVPEFIEARSLIPDNLLDRLNHYRNLPEVDYNFVIPTLYRSFHALYEVFDTRHVKEKSSRFRAFREFCEKEGSALKQYGIFEALRERFNKPWWEWPPDLTDSLHDIEDRATFFRYLQFITHEQLASVKKYAHACNPPVKLYLDLSVSVDAGGFDAWHDRDVYTLGARIGAPPDDFNPHGQEWGVVPMIPHRLMKARYKPFIETIRKVMAFADILRIDHVMGFFRLFWVPPGLKPADGAYVRYPMDDMTRIVALESIRNNCLVVGEDLGTVPDEVRREMERRKFLSYRVFYFEKHSNGSFKKPYEYPEYAVATVTTHDLPTFKGYWMERDIEVRSRLGTLDENSERILREERARDRLKILEVLSEEGFECPEGRKLEKEAYKYENKTPPSTELILSVHRYLLKTGARMVSFQIEDLIGEENQPNLPGTTTEYPCWKIRWSKSLEEITSDTKIVRFFERTT